VSLAFVSQVSKHLNSLVKKHKERLRIESTTVQPATFHSYFASCGYLNCMIYAHESGCDWSDEACSLAAESGHLDCLKYLHENGCEWIEDGCTAAAATGQLECLKYMHENGCEWNGDCCTFAALNGHLDCLKYLHEHDCGWYEETCTSAAENRHFGKSILFTKTHNYIATPRLPQIRAWEWMWLECSYGRIYCKEWKFRTASIRTREWMWMGCYDLCVCRGTRKLGWDA